MAESVTLVSPGDISPNPENPRLIFREEELIELQQSIADQGILVPLTVYRGSAAKSGYVILDGERRWRCARRLNLTQLPVIVQPEPSPLQNIMMMFAIHHTRKEWDPLPTAKKLHQLEQLYSDVEGRPPSEGQLAQIASMTRGEVRRLKNILALPDDFQEELLEEAEKPRPDQTLTVDHVLEATRGAKALRRRRIITESEEERLTRAIVNKFRAKTLTSTVEPRLLSRMARAVQREQLSVPDAHEAVTRLIDEPTYTISAAFNESAARAELEHSVEQLVLRLTSKLETEMDGARISTPSLDSALRDLNAIIARLLGR